MRVSVGRSRVAMIGAAIYYHSTVMVLLWCGGDDSHLIMSTYYIIRIRADKSEWMLYGSTYCVRLYGIYEARLLCYAVWMVE